MKAVALAPLPVPPIVTVGLEVYPVPLSVTMIDNICPPTAACVQDPRGTSLQLAETPPRA